MPSVDIIYLFIGQVYRNINTDNLVLENIDCLQKSAVVSHDDSYLTKMIVVHTTLTTTS